MCKLKKYNSSPLYLLTYPTYLLVLICLQLLEQESWGFHLSSYESTNYMFCMLQIYHSVQEEWLMLWAYSGGQKTQWCCFWYKMLIRYILSSISATHGLCSELYRYELTQWRQTSIATGWANEGCTKLKYVPKGIPKRYTIRGQRGWQIGWQRELYNVG